MLRGYCILLALSVATPALAQESGDNTIMGLDPRPGVMPAENVYLRPGHANSDDRMFPDIAAKDCRVDGDTLYVLVENEGKVGSQSAVHVEAFADAAGVRASATTNAGKFKAGESRWVPLRSFAVKTASTSAQVFALDSARLVGASVTLPPAVPAALDRSGQGCNRCLDLNETNDRLVFVGTAIRHGKPE
jgi:hypothetical protein